MMNVGNKLLMLRNWKPNSAVKKMKFNGSVRETLPKCTFTHTKVTADNIPATASVGPSTFSSSNGRVDVDQLQHEDTEDYRKHSEGSHLEEKSAEPWMPTQDDRKVSGKRPIPPDPETCCESGCVNCVWIKYANEVNSYYPPEERTEKLLAILDSVEDYNVKMFLKMELDL